MKRRQFLKRTATLSLVLTGLPLGKKALAQNATDKFDVQYRSYFNKKEGINTVYILNLYSAGLKPDNADPSKNRMELEINKYNADYSSVEQSVKYELWIGSKFNDQGSLVLMTRNTKKLSGDLPLPNGLALNPLIKITESFSFSGADENIADILDKSGSPLVTLTYKSLAGDDEECFITTACVTEKGKADDCYELNTLRALRENYMRKNTQGKALLEEYEWLGPAVVSAVGECENRAEIYDYLYKNMIMPSVEMIEQGQYSDAVKWYKGFTLQLKKNFNL
ncbi:MAG: hypothetical protein KDE33_02305 [Bacteroidetes bacterium]|nr:hypothetical protein [Bacteroidota bacterium]